MCKTSEMTSQPEGDNGLYSETQYSDFIRDRIRVFTGSGMTVIEAMRKAAKEWCDLRPN